MREYAYVVPCTINDVSHTWKMATYSESNYLISYNASILCENMHMFYLAVAARHCMTSDTNWRKCQI
jgi:hypothetical protein